jgi:hypothetical protein
MKQVAAVPASASQILTARENGTSMISMTLKRTVAAFLICLLGFSSAAFAETGDGQATQKDVEQQKRVGMYKIIGGVVVASVGFMLIANSHDSATVKSSFGTFKASTTNTGGMVAGVTLLGAGGLLAVLGVKDRRAKPSLGFTVGRTNSVLLTKRW